MDVDQLRYFCTVANLGSIQKASELLHLSPAALSKSIKRLEEDLDQQLFTPSGRGIVLTSLGEELAGRAQLIIDEIDSLQVDARRGFHAPKALRLASFEVFTTHFLGPLIRDYFPEIDLLLYELTPGHLEEALIEKKVDYAITYLPIPRGELDFLKVTEIEMAIFTSARFDETRSFEEWPFAVPVTPIQGSPNKVSGLDGWPDHLIQRRFKYRVTMMESALELCRQGLAAAYLPEFVVDLHNEKSKENLRLKRQTPPRGLPQEVAVQSVYLVKRKSDPENPITKRLARALRQNCQISAK